MVVSRFSADLSQLMYSTYIGGSLWDFGGAMAVDPTGAVWIAGNTQSPNFPVTADAMQPTFGGEVDAFLLKLDTTPAVPPTPPNTPAGAATTITASDSGASVSFGAVTTAGDTTLAPVDAASLPLTLPGGFALSGLVQAYEIHTTAGVSELPCA
jgi:hypothetical protein